MVDYHPDYIECAGIRIPRDWTPARLAASLAARRIRFKDEAEIMAVYGDSLKIVAVLTDEKESLRNEMARLEHLIDVKKSGLECPQCGFFPSKENIKAAMAAKKKRFFPT